MFPSTLRRPRFALKSLFVLMLGIAIGFALSKWPASPLVNYPRTWDLLGLNLSEDPHSTFDRLQTRYRGDMHVNYVRPNSAAAREGILPGDILVGLHKW